MVRRLAILVLAVGVLAAVPSANAAYPVPYAQQGGDGLVSKVAVSFLGGPAAAAQRNDPSHKYAAEKQEFGSSRSARWFGR